MSTLRTCLLLLIAATCSLVGQQRVYFIGNSITEFSAPYHIEDYASTSGIGLIDTTSGGKVGWDLYSGKSLDYEVANPNNWDTDLAAESWDVVVMQPHTYGGGMPLYHEIVAANTIIETAQAQNPDTVFYILGPYCPLEGNDPGTFNYTDKWAKPYNRPEWVASMTPWRSPNRFVEYETLFNTRQGFQSLFLDPLRKDNPGVDIRWIPLGEVMHQIDLEILALDPSHPLKNAPFNLTEAWDLITDRVHLGVFNGIDAKYLAHLTLLSTIWNQRPQDLSTVFDVGEGTRYPYTEIITPEFRSFADPIIERVVSANRKRHYVDIDATAGLKNGTSWANAFVKLQDAIDAAALVGGDIWVAEGTYYPDERDGQPDGNETSTFHLLNEVAIYGGFNGTETIVSQRNCDPNTNGTILSGDIDQNDEANFLNYTNNAHHVITATDNNLRAVLDGFTITGGNAVGGNGGGLSCTQDGFATFRNCNFIFNQAENFGGAAYVANDSNLKFYDCQFENNRTTSPTGQGGATYNEDSSHLYFFKCTFENNDADQGGALYVGPDNGVTLMWCALNCNTATDGGAIYANWTDSNRNYEIINCEFSINSATGSGGAIYSASQFTITNGTFAGNSATSGGAIYKGNVWGRLHLRNSILWDNTVEPLFLPVGDYGYSGSHNLIEGAPGSYPTIISSSDPLFVEPPNLSLKDVGNLKLLPGSPAIDQGNGAFDLDSYTGGCCEPINVHIDAIGLDLSKNPRIQNSTIDLGSRELEPFFFFMGQAYPGVTDPAIVSYTADPDGDLISNLLEWAHGLDATDPDSSGINMSGLNLTTPGLPVVYLSSVATGVDFRAVFSRVINHESLNLKYTVQFSSDLTTWYDSTEETTFLDTDGTIDLVSVPYPFFLPNFTKAKFFRVVVTFE